MKNKQKLAWPLVANTSITAFLEKSIAGGSLGGAYIFDGPDNLGKTSTARFLSAVILCENQDSKKAPCRDCNSCRKFFNQEEESELSQEKLGVVHGDFHIIKKEKDKKNIGISQVRSLIRVLSMSSFGNAYKLGLIKHAESLTREAANALLKTLEEPKEKVIIILICQDASQLPKTIVSRCQVLHFKPVSSQIIYNFLLDEYGTPRAKARNISRLCQGRPALALKFLEDQVFFDTYIERAKACLKIQSSDINGRFKIIESLLPSSLRGPESFRVANRILEIWQGVARDWLLLLFGHNNLIQHMELATEIRSQQFRYDINDLINLNILLAEGKKNLNANLKPRLVFENIAVKL